MIEGARIDAIAQRLRDAYGHAPIASLRDEIDISDAATAYAIQNANTAFWTGQGRRVAGRKVGLTAKAVQVQLGVDQPDYGVLFEDMEIPDGGVFEVSKALQPKAEAEVAFTLKSDLQGPDIDADDVVAAIDRAFVAIEIVDSRIRNWDITFADTVCDNGSSSHYVLGSEGHAIDGLDLYTCGMVLELNGAVASIGAGAACLGHPLNAAAWLARTVGLKAGQVVLTGALGPMVALSPGDEVVAKVGGLGAVSFTCGSVT